MKVVLLDIWYNICPCIHSMGESHPHFKEAISRLAGAGPRGVNWVASHPLWEYSVHNTNSVFEHSDLLHKNHPSEQSV